MKNDSFKDKSFQILKNLLKKHSGGLEAHKDIIGSKAKVKKQQFHLYGKKEVSIVGRSARKIYVAGIIQQIHFIGFYFMPIYSHPKEFSISDADLNKSLKGKSCFHITTLSPAMLLGLEAMLIQGVRLYRKKGWI